MPDQRRPSLADAIAAARRQLLELAAVAAHAHSLAYDRPGLRCQPGRVDPDPDRLPVRVVRGRATAAADDAWAANYLDAAVEIAWADQQISAAASATVGRRIWPLETSQIRINRQAPTPALLARVCLHAASALAGLEHADLPPAARRLLEAERNDRREPATGIVSDARRGALLRIDRAHRLLPDTRNPPRPPPCKARLSPSCNGLGGWDKTRGWCQPCYNLDYSRTGKPKTKKRKRQHQA